MNRVFAALLAVGLVLGLESIAAAGVIVTGSNGVALGNGLIGYTLTISGTDGKTVAGIASLSISGVHQVWKNSTVAPAPTNQTNDVGDLSGSFWKSAWNAWDTHLLIDAGGDPGWLTSPGFGQTETNDGTNPAGLDLTGPTPFEAFPGVAGLGTYEFTGLGPQISPLGTGPASVDFLYVVLPTGATATLTGQGLDSDLTRFYDITTVVGHWHDADAWYDFTHGGPFDVLLQFEAVGGTEPYTWSDLTLVSSPGVGKTASMDSDGLFSWDRRGAAAGAWTWSAMVTDANNLTDIAMLSIIVPEPTSIALVGLAVLGFVGLVRRR